MSHTMRSQMNRAQRRALDKTISSGAKEPWEIFTPGPLPRNVGWGTGELEGVTQTWRNNIYAVLVKPVATAWGEVTHLMVRRHDEKPIHAWHDLQRIKDEIVGRERAAVEVYPARSQLVDNAHMFHLWVLPEGFTLPFGLHKE